MYQKRGWEIVDDLMDADLVQFTGGSDVSPSLYNEWAHQTTYSDFKRDQFEQSVYEQALAHGIAMAGICRGGQFLNVMNGGKMYQDVNNHAIHGTHEAYIVGNNIPVQVSSTHHQMMRPNTSPNSDCHILMTANLSTRLTHMSDMATGNRINITVDPPAGKTDIEALYYGSTNCLCFQPHPEFTGPQYADMTDTFFNFIEYYLFGDVNEVHNTTISSKNLEDA